VNYLRHLSFLLAIFFTTQVQSQDTWEVQPLKYRWSVGVTAGNLLFYGDVAEFVYPWEKDLSEYKWAYGLVFRKDITPAIYLQGQGLSGTITGIREKYSNGVFANEEFKANLFEYNLCAKVNFYRMIVNKPSRLGIYALGGVGNLHYRSQMKNTVTDAVVRYVGYDNTGAKTSMESDLIFPFGIGAGFALNEKINLNLDATYRYINSDLLDSREGKTDVKDIYGYTSVGIVYKLGFKERRPRPNNDGPDYIADDYDTDYNDAYDYDYNDGNDQDSTVNITNDNNTVTIDTDTYNYSDTASNNNYVDYTDNQYTNTVDNNYSDTTNQVTNNYNQNTYTDNQNNNDTYSDSQNYNNVTNNTDLNNNYNNNTYTDNQSDTYTNNVADNNNYTPSNTYSDGLSFKVQIAASYNKPLDKVALANKHNINQPINEDKIGNWYKYTVGDFKEKDDANALRKQIGVNGAFIAPYNYGSRVEQDEALALMRQRNVSTVNTGSLKDAKMVVSLSSDPEIISKRVFYAVQVAASKKPLSDSYIRTKFNVDGSIYQDYVDGWYKYSVGVFGGFEEANQLKRRLRGEKVEGAFVVAYHNNKRIDANEAKKISNNQSSTYTPSGTYNSNTGGYYSTTTFNDASSIVQSSTNSKIYQNKVYYTVQIAASKKKLSNEFFKNTYGINEPIFNDAVEGWNKYSIGVFDNFKDANNYRKKISREKGIKGVFVAAYHNDKRIPQQDARKMLKNK
jgi:hypothetical protein